MTDPDLHPAVLKDRVDKLHLAQRKHWGHIKALNETTRLHASRISDLEQLEDDLHKYCRNLEDRFNELVDRMDELDGKSDSPDDPEEKTSGTSFLDLIHGPTAPFYERFREGCGFNRETLNGETIAKMLRFMAVEVEKMTDRSMAGSFTVSNLHVGRKLREFADEAAVEDYVFSYDEMMKEKE